MAEVHRPQVVPNNPHTTKLPIEGYCVTCVCVSDSKSRPCLTGHSPVEVSSDKVVYLLLRLSMELLKPVGVTVWDKRRKGGGVVVEGVERKWEGKGESEGGRERRREREREGKGEREGGREKGRGCGMERGRE